MFSNKIKITLIFDIIFLLSVVSVTQAAPPLQGRSGTSQGHALDLDAEGNNLGTAMKNSNAEGGASDNNVQNHVALALANYFNEMSYEDIMALHEGGVGFGNIARALYFTKTFDLGIGAADLAVEAGQSGWGKTLRNNGIHPGSLGKGRGNQPEQAGAKANNGQGNGNGNGNNGQGNGNGKGNNGQGQGKGKNKSGSDGVDPDVDSDDDDDAADTDVDSEDNEDDDNGNGNGQGQGKGKGNNGQGKGRGNNSKGNGNGNGNGNHGQGNGNNGNNDNNGQNSSEGN